MHDYLEAWTHYADFNGRSARVAYWKFCGIAFIIEILFDFLQHYINTDAFVILNTLYSLAIIIPSLAYEVRRLHDTDRSGWHLLWILLPLIGWIILLVFLLEKGRPNPNIYGSNPLEAI